MLSCVDKKDIENKGIIEFLWLRCELFFYFFDGDFVSFGKYLMGLLWSICVILEWFLCMLLWKIF